MLPSTRPNSTVTATPELRSTMSPSEDECVSLIQKTPKTKRDLENLRDIMIASASSNDDLFHKYRFESLRILLKFKKYDWIDEIFTNFNGDLKFEDHIILVSKAALLGKFETIKDNYKDWSPLDLMKLLDNSTLILHSFHRPRPSLSLWITLVSIHYPDLNIKDTENYSVLSASLSPILLAFKDVNDLSYLFEFVKSDSAIKNLLFLLGQKYSKRGLKEQTHRLWHITPNHLHTAEYSALILELLIIKDQYLDAFQLFQRYPHLQSDRSKTLIIRILLKLPFHEDQYFSTVLSFLQESRLFAYQVESILSTYLKKSKLKEFDELAEAFKKGAVEPSVGIMNLYMRRASRNSSSNEILEYLRQIHELKKKPNQGTFLILLEKFANIGDSKSAMSLLELLAERGDNLTIYHINLALRAAIRRQELEAFPKINKLLKTLNITPDLKFVENVMEFHFVLGEYRKVIDMFIKISPESPSMKMYSLLLQAFIIKKDFLSAHATFNIFKEKSEGAKSSPDYYLTVIQYYSLQGLFSDALDVIKEMKRFNVKTTSAHYHFLMSSYNRRGRYADSMVIFNLMNDENVEPDSLIYRDLLVSLVQLSIINKGNFQDPISVVDSIINESQTGKLPIKGALPFLVVKPVIHALIKFYKPDDAYRIMTNFRVINPNYNVDQKVNFMKQELLLFSTINKWGSFGITYDNFQNRIKTLLTVEGQAPRNLKKTYNSIIKIVFQYFVLKKQLREFAKLFHDLIFVHGFTFTSNHINWVVRRLITNRNTFHDALYLVEKKLIGGFVAKQVLKLERANSKRSGGRFTAHVSQDRYLRPRLALGYIYKSVVEAHVYNYIMGGKGHNPVKRAATITELKEKYPRTMRHLPLILKRIRRRETYFNRVKMLFPESSTKQVVRAINKKKREAKKKMLAKKRLAQIAKSRAHLVNY
jgi:pentatricopeptide repeat protein